MKKPDQILEEGAKTFRERQDLYGDSWLRAGETLHSLFPNGLTVNSPKDWSRLAIFMHEINKVRRQASQFSKGGHIDSSHDLMVYASMMEALEGGDKTNGPEKNDYERNGSGDIYKTNTDKKYISGEF